MIVSNGMMITGLSIYDEQILNEFNWSLSAYKFSGLVSLCVAGFFAPVAGMIIDRYGTRVCILTGWCALAVAYFCFSLIQSLTHLYLVHVLFGITLTLIGLNVAVSLTSSWAKMEKRGISVGIAIAGSSLGGIFFPQIEKFLLFSFDWRTTIQIVSAIPLAMLIYSFFGVHDNMLGAKNKSPSDKPVPGMPFREVIRTRSFWAIVFIASATFYCILGAQSHLFLYARSLGLDAPRASDMVSIFFFCSLIGKFLFGYLADLYAMRKVFYANLFTMLLGGILLVSMVPETVLVAMVLFGLGWGGVYTLIQYSIVTIFGLRDIGKIMGILTMFDAIAGGLGIFLSGVVKEATNSYQPVFAIYLALLILCVLAFTQVRPVKITASA